MIVGIGVDLVENASVQHELARGAWLVEDGIFTPSEISRSHAARDAGPYYAACFAAKEAVLKAFGVAVGDLARFREVEVRLANEPSVVLSGRLKRESEQMGAKCIRLSVTHSRKLTGAMVTVEG